MQVLVQIDKRIDQYRMVSRSTTDLKEIDLIDQLVAHLYAEQFAGIKIHSYRRRIS